MKWIWSRLIEVLGDTMIFIYMDTKGIDERWVKTLASSLRVVTHLLLENSWSRIKGNKCYDDESE